MLAVNPATETPIKDYPEQSPEELDDLLSTATGRAREWRRRPIEARAKLMEAAADELESGKDGYARIMTEEMGKPITEAISEIEKCAWVCRYFADQASDFLSPTMIETDASSSYVQYDPLGVILAIMPWNFPYWQYFRFAAPALMAGNVALLKHAENVPGCARAIESIFRKAGFPEGVTTTLLIDIEYTSQVIGHDSVKAVTLTGSPRAGEQVAAKAGSAIKKTVLELGGSDPFIVCEDADLELALDGAVTGRTLNGGQSCIAAKRFLVDESIAEEFQERFVERMDALKVGDPMDRTTDIGPLARQDLLDNLSRQVEESVERGARVLTGGSAPTLKGFFFDPTVLGNVEPGMPAFDEETFGPVAALTRTQGVAEAIKLANDTPYGLGASIWTANQERAAEIAGELEAGAVFINGIVKSDPRLPFGGVKRSGYGRELARDGIVEFVNKKTVWIR